MTTPRTRVAIWCAYICICLIWGTTWLAIKIGIHGIPVLTGVGLRFIIAGLSLYVVVAIRGEIRPLREVPWRLVFVLATFLFGLNYILTYTAETRLDSGLVSVLFGTLPFFAFGFANVMIGERVTARVLVGALIAFGGVAVISLAGEIRGSLLYALCPIAAAAGSAYSNVYAKRHSHHAPLLTLPPAMLISGIVVFAIGRTFEHIDLAQALAPASIGALLYLAILGSSVAFFLMLWLMQRIPVGTIAMSSLVFPAIAITVGALFGGEHFTLRELIGSAFVVLGMYLALSSPGATAEQTLPEIV